MKFTKLSAMIGVLALLACSTAAAVFAPVGPVTFRLTVMGQNQDNALVLSRTNASATVTNVIQVYRSTVTNGFIANFGLLRLLTNSFATNLPAGARLAMRGSTFLVVDATGTHVLLDVSSVLSISTGNGVDAGGESLITTQDGTGTHYSGSDTRLITEVLTLTYDDSLKTTGDGTHVQFELQGLSVGRRIVNFKTSFISESFVFTGQGDGTISGSPVVIRGVATFHAAGTP